MPDIVLHFLIVSVVAVCILIPLCFILLKQRDMARACRDDWERLFHVEGGYHKCTIAKLTQEQDAHSDAKTTVNVLKKTVEQLRQELDQTYEQLEIAQTQLSSVKEKDMPKPALSVNVQPQLIATTCQAEVPIDPEKTKAMWAIVTTCRAAGVPIPNDVTTFFGGKVPDTLPTEGTTNKVNCGAAYTATPADAEKGGRVTWRWTISQIPAGTKQIEFAVTADVRIT